MQAVEDELALLAVTIKSIAPREHPARKRVSTRNLLAKQPYPVLRDQSLAIRA